MAVATLHFIKNTFKKECKSFFAHLDYLSLDELKEIMKKEFKLESNNDYGILDAFSFLNKEYYFFINVFSPKILAFKKSMIDYLLKHKENIKALNMDLTINNNSFESEIFLKFTAYIKYNREMENYQRLYFFEECVLNMNYDRGFEGISFGEKGGKRILTINPNNKEFNIIFKETSYSQCKKFIPISTIKDFRYCYVIGYFYFQALFKDNPILRDLSKSDLKHIKVPLENFKNLTTKQALIEAILGIKVPYNLNKLPFKVGFSFAGYLALGIIGNKDTHKFYSYLLENAKSFPLLAENIPLTRGVTIKRKKYELYSLIEWYFYQKIDINSCFWVRDSINMALSIKESISLKIKSQKGTKREHDRILEAFLSKESKNSKKLKIAPHFKALAKRLPKSFELINQEARLQKEGLVQNNCVYSYKETINNGMIAIFSLLYENQRYTLEISYNKRKNAKNLYTLRQVKGKNNTEASNEVKLMVDGVLTKIQFNKYY